MARIQINLTDQQERVLRSVSTQRGNVPISELVREAIDAHFGLPREVITPGRPRRDASASLELVGAFSVE